MADRWLADAALVLHLAFIVFAVAGALLALRWRWVVALHLPALAWAALIEFEGWTCPLTPLENRWRIAGGAAGYRGGFIEHYLVPLIYPDALTPQLQWWLGGGLLAVNALAYALVFRRWRSSVFSTLP